MLMLLDSSVLVSVASVDLEDPTLGFPSPKCHHIQWFKPRSGLQSLLYSVYSPVSALGASGD
jgi:hypothetical protein